MPATSLDFHYTRVEVISAQRMRFLRSNQLKVILLIWLGSMLYLIAPLVLPQVFPPGPNTSWALVLQIALAYGVTLLVLIFLTPWVDFYINRLWRLPLTFQFDGKGLRLSVTGKTGGLRLMWNQVHQVDENERVFILHYGGGNKFLVLPKSAFSRPVDEQGFRDLLARRAQIKEEPS
jgi:hypothetical protein